MKGSNKAPAGSLFLLSIPDGPWQDISTDFTTNHLLSNGFDSILIVIDWFSKETIFIPCNKTAMVLDTAKPYLYHIWKNHGLPQSIVLDRGSEFASQVMQDVCKRLGIMSKLSTAHHLQTDGQTERMNQDLQQYLCMFYAEKQDEWSDWLPSTQFSYMLESCNSGSTLELPELWVLDGTLASAYVLCPCCHSCSVFRRCQRKIEKRTRKKTRSYSSQYSS